MKRKRIVLVTSSQPSLNPRMVKEADALAHEGHEVIVIGQHWHAWASVTDKTLLGTKKWKYIEVGGSPDKNKATYLVTRLIHKIGRKLREKLTLKGGIAELSMGRCGNLLYREAIKQRADLYIGHNPGGLAPAINAAKYLGVKCGFDAEDFHRREYSDDPNHPDVLCKTFLEEKYFPRADYLTTSSPLITKEYIKIFPQLEFNTILNVFPKVQNINVKPSLEGSPLKLIWFSQTLGHNRGIAEIITAIGIVNNPLVELHLLANPRESNIKTFNAMAEEHGLKPHQLNYHPPLPPGQLFSFCANFDIGMASETGFGTNNNLALSNKLFTYFASGLAILYSDTPAQENLMKGFANCGIQYGKKDPNSLAEAVGYYLSNRKELNNAKASSYRSAQTVLNWENESEKLISLINNLLK